MPKCRKCFDDKPSEDFPVNSSYSSGRATMCKPCSAKMAAYYRKQNPFKYKARKFNTTEQKIKHLFDTYKTCQICQEEDRKALCIDHDHKTGQVRGLLCDNCNKAIGCLHDDLYILEKAKQYLMRTTTTRLS